MVRTSASDELDLGSIPESGQAEDFRILIFRLPCLTFSIFMDSVEEKLASSLVVSLGKELNRIPPALRGRQSAIVNRTM